MSNVVSFIKNKDESLFFIFNRKINCIPLSFLMHFFTFFGSTLFSLFLCLSLIYLSRYFSLRLFFHVITVISISQIIVQTIKRLVVRPRPCYALSDAIIKKFPPVNSYSFPSGHTCTAFCIAFTLSEVFTSFAPLFYVMAMLVGLSRIYLGMHYPTDVLIGGILGYAAFALSNIIF
jgi:undecaprenyl-diphosphatase